MYQSSVFKGIFVAQKILLPFLLLLIIFLLFSTDLYAHVETMNETMVEQTDKLDPEKLFADAKKLARNVPTDEKPLLTDDCVKFPNFQDLEFHASSWQVLRGNETAYLLSAYYDARPILKTPVVRIIAYMDSAKPQSEIWCRMWFKRGSDEWVRHIKTSKYNILWYMKYYKIQKGEFVGQLITCPVPEDEADVPYSVSLAANKCDPARNNLKVQYEKPQNGTKKDVLVCVKHLDFPYDDESVRLVQFLETNFLFGVDKVVLYGYQAHPNVLKVVDRYSGLGKVDYIPMTIPAGAPNDPYLRHLWLQRNWMTNIILEPIELNDCFYRHMHQYHYIALLDTDEVFVPKEADSYAAMLNQVRQENPQPTSNYYCINKMMVRNSDDESLEPDLPSYLDFLQVTTQAVNYPEPQRINRKSFLNTSTSLTVNNHRPYATLGKKVETEIPEGLGQVNHYRKSCFFEKPECREEYEVRPDYALWRFKDQLVAAVVPVVEELGLV